MSRSASTVLFHGQNVTGQVRVLGIDGRKGRPKHVQHTCSF